MTTNKKNNQVSFHLKKKQLKKIGITPDYLLNVTIPNPRAKFYKKSKGGTK